MPEVGKGNLQFAADSTTMVKKFKAEMDKIGFQNSEVEP